MKKPDHAFWPYKPKSSIFLAFLLLVILILIIGIIHYLDSWPSDISTNTVLIFILIVSIIPILLAILDIIIERGGTIGYGDFKLDFSKGQEIGFPSITVPANIGVRGLPVSDSATENILSSLRQAISNPIAIIDLEDGKVWWETRLLVLLSGAKRLGRPDKIVFVATRQGKEKSFIGWAHPENLIKILLDAHPKYKPAYDIARAVSSQWSTVEPTYPVVPPVVNAPPVIPPMHGRAMYKLNWAFDLNTGLKNDLFEEQVLQHELGLEVENQEGGRFITTGRVIDLFDKILHTTCIDQNWSSEEQLKTIFENDLPYIALTENGIYKSLISRFAIQNEILKKLTLKESNS